MSGTRGITGIRGRLLAVIGGAVVAMLLSGCGLSTDDSPEAITGSSVESSASTTPPTLVLPSEAGEEISVWFLLTGDAGDGETVLEEAPRHVPRPATAASHLEALLGQPPDDDERERGVWSALPPDATLASRPRQEGHVLVVDMPEGVYEDLHGIIAQNAFAQIVYTATAIDGVESVRFERDGSLFEAVDGEGQASADPLGRDDFVELVPPTTTPSPR